MHKSESKIALLIDADNAPASKIDAIISEIAKYGVANIRKAYGNWKNPLLKAWEDNLHEFAIASSSDASPLFGIVTNGNNFIFIKIDRQNKLYDFSETYSMLSRTNHLYDVLQILKAIAHIFLAKIENIDGTRKR